METFQNQCDYAQINLDMPYRPPANVRPSKVNQFLATAKLCLRAVNQLIEAIAILFLSVAAAGTGHSWTALTSKMKQFLATTILCLSAVAAGMGFVSTLTLDLYQGTCFLSLFVYGTVAGSLLAGLLAERVGRKLTAIIIGFPFIFSWLLTVCASDAIMLKVARFLIGFASGGSFVFTPLFISEFADNSIRGTLGTCFRLFLTIGMLLMYILTGAAPLLAHWLNVVLPAVYIVLMLFVPESPMWLLKNNRLDDAAKSMQWFRVCDSHTEIHEIQQDREASDGFGDYRDLITVPANRNGLFITCSLMFFQQFSGIHAVTICMNPPIVYDIFWLVQLPMAIVSAVLVEIVGRKWLLVQSSLIMGLCLMILGWYFHLYELTSSLDWLPVVCLFLFLVSFSLGYGPIPWIMMSELFAPDVRGIATALAVLFNWVNFCLVTEMLPFVIGYVGVGITFVISGGIMLLGTIYGKCVLFETKGKDTAQIQMLLAS